MLYSLIFLLPSVATGSLPADLERADVARLIDGAEQPACRDIVFDYEGKLHVPGPIERESLKLGPDGIRSIYTGTFRRRSDGAYAVDVYTLDKRRDRMRHDQVAILGERMESSSIHADEKKAKILVNSQGPLRFAGPGNYRSIWLADWVRKFAESPYMYDFLGYQRLDGVECLVVRFRLALDDSEPRPGQLSHTFWIDLNRGGHVVRHEDRKGDNLAGLTTVRLEKFTPGPGRVVWLPVSGRNESRVGLRSGKMAFLDEPVAYDTYDMIPVTLRFDQGLKDADFSIKAKSGDVVSDELRKAKYQFGQYMVRPKGTTKQPTDVEVKANLDRMLKDKAVLANELKASSPLREGPGWSSYWPWGLAGLAAVGIGVVYYRRRGA